MELDQARRRLEQERERLEGIRGSHMTRPLEQSQQEDSSELSSFGQHPADAGSDTVERQQAESIAEHVEGALAEVDDALRRIDDGTYGACATCGEQIPDERLEARPETRHCTEHQAELERSV